MFDVGLLSWILLTCFHQVSDSEITDPRLSRPNYTMGPDRGNRRLRKGLYPLKWPFDDNSILPIPDRIIITGLSPLAKSSEVAMHFKMYGDIRECELKVDPSTGASLGICTVRYWDRRKEKYSAVECARLAARKGNGTKIMMDTVKVMVDIDGTRAEKLVEYHLRKQQREQEEAARREAAERAKTIQPPSAPRAIRELAKEIKPSVAPGVESSKIEAPTAPKERPRNPVDLPTMELIEERPYIFISDKNFTEGPGGDRLLPHMKGKFKSWEWSHIRYEAKESGYFVIFRDFREAERCFVKIPRDFFTYELQMELHKPRPRVERSESNAGKTSEKQADGSADKHAATIDEPPKRTNPIDEILEKIMAELKQSLLLQTRRKITQPLLHELLDPVKLKKQFPDPPAVHEKSPFAGLELRVDTPSEDIPKTPSAPVHRAGALPRFKKRTVPKKQAMDVTYRGRDRKLSRAEARPLHHHFYGSENESDDETATDTRPGSRGMSEIPSEDSRTPLPDERRRIKSKSKLRETDTPMISDDEGSATPAVSKPGNVQDDDDEDEDEKILKPSHEVLDTEMNGVLVEVIANDGKHGKEAHSSATSDSPSDEEKEPDSKRPALKRVKIDHEPVVDDIVTAEITPESLDVDEDELLPSRKRKAETPEPQVKLSGLLSSPERKRRKVHEDTSWAVPSPLEPTPTFTTDTDIILDLDGIQDFVKDDEDLEFLKEALEGEEPVEMGNVFAWAYQQRDCKLQNNGGVKGKRHDRYNLFAFPLTRMKARPKLCRKLRATSRSIPQALHVPKELKRFQRLRNRCTCLIALPLQPRGPLDRKITPTRERRLLHLSTGPLQMQRLGAIVSTIDVLCKTLTFRSKCWLAKRTFSSLTN